MRRWFNIPLAQYLYLIALLNSLYAPSQNVSFSKHDLNSWDYRKIEYRTLLIFLQASKIHNAVYGQ